MGAIGSSQKLIESDCSRLRPMLKALKIASLSAFRIWNEPQDRQAIGNEMHGTFYKILPHLPQKESRILSFEEDGVMIVAAIVKLVGACW